MDAPARHLVILGLPDVVRQQISAIRTVWDPVMAARMPPHITLIYDQEITDVTVLHARLRQRAPIQHPFTLTLGAPCVFDTPTQGIYRAVQDATHTLAALRAHLLRSPLRHVWNPYTPHITLIHPRTSARAPAAWPTLKNQTLQETILIESCMLMGERNDRWELMHEYQFRRAT